eukprot:scaffold3582_cov143-Skeletonema_marinoi.AAC.7
MSDNERLREEELDAGTSLLNVDRPKGVFHLLTSARTVLTLDDREGNIIIIIKYVGPYGGRSAT